MIGSAILLGVKIGGAYAIGNYAGGWLAAKVPGAAKSDPARIGIKIGTGVVAFMVLSVFA